MNQKKPSIFFVGLMAVGKSTVGRLLAQSVHLPFLDTDHLIEERAGADIAWIFDVEGEAGFRERECQVIEEYTQMDGVVLATGGGAILAPSNRQALSSRGTVIHLVSPIERILSRTAKDKKRPLLQGVDQKKKLLALEAQRKPLYREIEDYSFTTDRQGPKVLARRIEERLTNDGILSATPEDDRVDESVATGKKKRKS